MKLLLSFTGRVKLWTRRW